MRFIYAISILIIVFLCGCGGPKDIKGEQQIAEQFLMNAQSHQFEQAYQLLSPEAKATGTWEGLKQGILNMESQNGAIKGWELQRHSVSVGLSSYVILDYELRGEDKNKSAILRISEGKNGLQIDKVDFND